MVEFLQECYIGAGRAGLAQDVQHRLDAIAAGMTAEGTPIRLIRSMLVPEDETWFLLWEADTSETVRRASTRAGIACDRITEVLPLEAASPEPPLSEGIGS